MYIVYRTCRLALKTIIIGKIVVYIKRSDNPTLEEMVVDPEVGNTLAFLSFRALHPSRSFTLGKTLSRVYNST